MPFYLRPKSTALDLAQRGLGFPVFADESLLIQPFALSKSVDRC